MMVLAGTALLALAQTTTGHADVAYEQMIRGNDRAAIDRIEQNEALDADDPARLINLGVAYARQGETERARAMFEAALAAPTRAELETANGEWVDSRWLARRGLAMLADGRLENAERMAAR